MYGKDLHTLWIKKEPNTYIKCIETNFIWDLGQVQITKIPKPNINYKTMKKNPIKSIFLLVIAVTIFSACTNQSKDNGDFTIDSKGKFLLSSSSDGINSPLIIDLQELKLNPGDEIFIEVLGEYLRGGGSGMSNGTNAVFSTSNVILDKSELNRIPGAIDCGVDIKTNVTWFEKLPTDIPEDFDATSAEVVIPEDSKYLFVGVTDGYVSDNAADSTYRLIITLK